MKIGEEKPDQSDVVETKPQEPVKIRPLKTTKDIVRNASAYRRLIPASKVEPITKMKMKSKYKRKVAEKIPKNVGKTIRKKLDAKPRDIWDDGTVVKSKPNKKVPSLLPAVELPHPGTSVNPAREDHQDLLKKAQDIELARLKEEKHLNRVLTRYQKKAKSEKELQKEYIKDMSAGLFPTNEVEEFNHNDENVGEDLKNGPIKRVVRAEDRKSKAKRRREMIAKMEMERKKQEKEKRVKEAQVFQLKRFKKEIAAQEKLTQARIEERKKKEEEKMFQPHRLGPYKYKEPEIALNTTDELKGRLREVKTAGNPFEERFKSLQKRNLIEPRELILKTFKKNVKYVLKRDHREDTDLN